MSESRINQSSFRSYLESDVSLAITYLQDQKNFTIRPQVDLFAFAFICLSRYEEYVILQRDQHQRLQADTSFLNQYEVLDEPIVDYVLIWFQQYVEDRCGSRLDLNRLKSTDLTIDVDHCWKYAHKGFLLNTYGFIKDICTLRWRECLERYLVLREKISDPYDINKWKEMYQIDDATYFFLLSKRSDFDKGHAPYNHELQTVITDLISTHNVGIHPGYYTYNDKRELTNQLQAFEHISGIQPVISRQHYLRLSIPQTYQNLVDLGITEDYTMGYADKIGYRAGTSRPFNWFDLESNATSSLQIKPFALMDVTLYKYLKLNAEEAMIVTNKVIQNAKIAKGTCRVIWHNSSPVWQFPWKEYEEVFSVFTDSKKIGMNQ